jgi:hypothetical protein
MTDKRIDHVEEDRLDLDYVKKLHAEGIVGLDIQERLINEVEKLRVIIESLEVESYERMERIDSLTKERDELQKEVDGDNEDLERMFALRASKVRELEAENAELKDKLAKYQINERWQDNQAQQMITDQTETILRLNGEVRSLKAQLSESQKQVKQ